MILVRCYLPLRYSCSVLTSSADSSFIEQIERVAAIAAFIVVKYGSLKRSTHAKNRKRCGEASTNSNGARRRNAKAARMSSGAEISSSRRLEQLYKPHANCLQTAASRPRTLAKRQKFMQSDRLQSVADRLRANDRANFSSQSHKIYS